MQNTLYTNDNLFVLYGMNSEIADLIYLDPPFNSKRMYSAPVGTKAAGASFKDMWTWDDINDAYLDKLIDKYPNLVNFIQSIGQMHSKGMMAYVTYMTQRLIEMHRVLKSTGSIYLHCDPTASHYLKNVMDSIFGSNNFRNEITWVRSHQHNLASKRFDNVADIILFYTKSDIFTFNRQYSGISEKELVKKFPYVEEETGRRFTHEKLEQASNRKDGDYVRIIDGIKTETSTKLGWRWTQATFDERIAENPHLIYWTENGRPRYKRYTDEYDGRLTTNVWDDIKGLASNSKERTGYPTQKPLSLLHRIIKASSKVGDLVIDPFCGCATTCVAAQQLQRGWIGIDVEEQAVNELINRLSDDGQDLFTDFIHLTQAPQRTDLQIVLISKTIKQQMFDEQSGDCNGCGGAFEMRNLEIDHIVPKAKGGGDYMENYQLLCGSCNRIKGARPMEYLRTKIKVRLDALRDKITFGL